MTKANKQWFAIYFFLFCIIIYVIRMYHVSDVSTAQGFDAWTILVGMACHTGLLILYTTRRIKTAFWYFTGANCVLLIGVWTDLVDAIIMYWTFGIAVYAVGLSVLSMRITK